MKSLDLAGILDIPKLPIYFEQIQKQLVNIASSANPAIQNSINRLVTAKSKRLRPALLIAVVACHNKPIKKDVIISCAAIELIHIGSLVHDDIIDEAKSRWNIQTVNSLEGVNHAILVGDYLFAKACELGNSLGPDIGQLTASTIASLIDGESLEMADQYNVDRHTASLEKVMRLKTAALLSTACQVGGYCAELSPAQIKHLASYGTAFGMSFQLIDDLLDFLSSDELLGKPVGNDIREGVYTLPVLSSMITSNNKKLSKLLSNYTTSKHEDLVDLLIADGSIQQTILLAKNYNQTANKALRKTGNNRTMDCLSNLPDFYLDWALNHLTDKKYRSAISKMLT